MPYNPGFGLLRYHAAPREEDALIPRYEDAHIRQAEQTSCFKSLKRAVWPSFGKLKKAIDSDDAERTRTLFAKHPDWTSRTIGGLSPLRYAQTHHKHQTMAYIAPFYASDEQEGTRDILRADLLALLQDAHPMGDVVYQNEVDVLMASLLTHTVLTRGVLTEAKHYTFKNLTALQALFNREAFGPYRDFLTDGRCQYRTRKIATECVLGNLLRTFYPKDAAYPSVLPFLERSGSFRSIVEHLLSQLSVCVFPRREDAHAMRTLLEALQTALERIPKIPDDENTYDHLCCNVVLEKLPALYAPIDGSRR